MSCPSLAGKRGFGLTGGLWNRFGVVLIEAPIPVVSSVLTQYFRARCCPNIFPAPLNEREKHFLWQYIGHNWTVWWAFASEEVAFALALFLATKAIVLTHQGTSGWSTFKMFEQDKLVEYYSFGFDDRDASEKFGDRLFEAGYLDLEIVQKCIYPNSSIPSWYRHLFVSSIRTVTEAEMRKSFDTMLGEFGFLNATLCYYGVYLPDCQETPLTYSRSDTDFHPIQLDFERVDAVVLPKEAFYWENMLPVPNRVTQ